MIQKIISVILALFILFPYPTTALSQTTQPTPSPAPTTTDIVYEASDEANLVTSHEYYDENKSHDMYPNSATDSAIINTGDDAQILQQITDSVDVVIQNNNDIVLDRETNMENITGNNNSISNISLAGPIHIYTGNATSSADITTVVNTNITGNGIQPVIANIFVSDGSDFDISHLTYTESPTVYTTPEIQFSENSGNRVRFITHDELEKLLGVKNVNNIDIVNTITLLSATGKNVALDNIGNATGIYTGDASSIVDMFTMANTNITGSRGFFAVINLFDSMTGSIILPYEYPYIHIPHDDQSSTTYHIFGNDTEGQSERNTLLSTRVDNSNIVDLHTSVDTTTNTGDNEIIDSINFNRPGSITTGDTFSAIQNYDIINTNVTGDNYLYLRINHWGNWKGSIDGWIDPIIVQDDYILLVKQLSSNSPQFEELPIQQFYLSSGDDATTTKSATNSSIIHVDNTNNAKIANAIALSALTGENKAGRFNSEIETGDASVIGNVLNMVNTNITGNGFFYGIINILQEFTGSIIFPRPDLSLEKSLANRAYHEGDIITYILSYSNIGRIPASAVTITDIVPDGLEIISVSNDGIVNGNTIIWHIPEVGVHESGSVSITAKIKMQASDTIENTAVISTTTEEVVLGNNTSSVTLYIAQILSDDTNDNTPPPQEVNKTSINDQTNSSHSYINPISTEHGNGFSGTSTNSKDSQVIDNSLKESYFSKTYKVVRNNKNTGETLSTSTTSPLAELVCMRRDQLISILLTAYILGLITLPLSKRVVNRTKKFAGIILARLRNK